MADPEFSFANNFWGKDDRGVHNLLSRMHDAKMTNEEVHNFYKERIAIEEEYSRRLLTLSRKSLGAPEIGSLKQALEGIRTNTESMGKSHAAAANQLKAQLDEPLATFSSSIRARRKTIQGTVEKLLKAKTLQNATVSKARERYESDCNRINGYYAQQNLLMGKELERNNQKLDKVQAGVDGSKREYQNSLRVLAETIDRWNKEWKLSCDKMQDLEEERINFLKSNLWSYTNIVSTVCVSDDEGCENIRVALEKCDVGNDIKEFVKTKGTGSEIQDPPEFVNFLSGFSRDTQSYKVAQFERSTDSESTENHRDSSTSPSSLQRNDTSSTMSSTVSLNHSDLNSFPTPALSHSNPSSVMSSPVHGMASPNSSVYSNTSMSSQEESSASTYKRTWSSPFRKRSKKDLNRGWSQSSKQSEESDKYEDSTLTKKSAQAFLNTQQVSSVADNNSVLSMGDNMFDLGAGSVSLSKSASASPVKQFSRDDPLVAALERLKLSAQNSPAPAVSSPTSRHNSLVPPEPAFTATEMQKTSGRYTNQTREIFGANGTVENRGHPMQRPRSQIDLHRERERVDESYEPRTMRERPKSFYFGEAEHEAREFREPGDVRSGARSPGPYQTRDARPGARSPAPFELQQGDQGPYRAASPNPGRDRRSQGYHSSSPSSPAQARPISQGYSVPTGRSNQRNSYIDPRTVQATASRSRPRSKSVVDLRALPATSRDGRPVIRYSKAAYDYRAAIPEEVSFRKGDVMLVVRMQEDGWWEVEVIGRNQAGLAPSNFLVNM